MPDITITFPGWLALLLAAQLVWAYAIVIPVGRTFQNHWWAAQPGGRRGGRGLGMCIPRRHWQAMETRRHIRRATTILAGPVVWALRAPGTYRSWHTRHPTWWV